MMCFIGLYLLCGSFAFNVNQIYLLLCAFFFAIHILVIDYYSPKVDGVWLSCLQFLVVGVVSTVFAIILEEPTVAGVLTGWWTVLYAGILSSAVAYTLQIVGQQRTPAALASLVLSLESVVAVIASMIALRLYPTLNEVLGMVLIFAAIIVSQIPWHTLKKPKTVE